MNGADDCPSSLSQRLHKGNNLEAGGTVQATGHKMKQKTRADKFLVVCEAILQIVSVSV